MKEAVWVPLFDDLAEPEVVADLAARAEAAGWAGLFVWDHIRWQNSDRRVGDPWIALAAAACATSRIRIGPMVVPLPRYRPAALIRQTVSLDRLSGGRLILGGGLGSDRFGGEYSRFGEDPDPRRHAAMTDETLRILRAAWSGHTVNLAGAHYSVDHTRFLPTPFQRPGIPLWIAGTGTATAPRRRAGNHDGFVPVNVRDSSEFAEIVNEIPATNDARTFDFVATISLHDDAEAYRRAGATWVLREIQPELGLEAICRFVDLGPPTTNGAGSDRTRTLTGTTNGDFNPDPPAEKVSS